MDISNSIKLLIKYDKSKASVALEFAARWFKYGINKSWKNFIEIKWY